MSTENEAILKFIKSNKELLENDRVIFEILEGDLLDKIKEKMRGMLVSDRAFWNASKLIPPINLLRQVNTKLTTIYNEPPNREAEDDSDQELIDFYENAVDVNTVFHEANKFFNSQKRAAIEPFLDEGQPALRVLSGHHFLVHNSDFVNPLKMTEFLKFVGTRDKKDIWFVYSKDSFRAIDSDGELVPEFMAGNEGINPLGVIPQTYIKKSRNLLTPLPDTDTIQMSLLIPSMWASINYGINYQAHSVLYGIDIDFENIELNPDAFLSFKSEQDKKPELGSLKPEIDIAEVDKHILDLFNAWLESMNIRPGEGTGSGQNSVSGVALSIKEMDTTQNRKQQIRFFMDAEQEFWQKLKVTHNHWVETNQIQGFKKFSESFAPIIEFNIPDGNDDEDKKVDRELKKIKGRLDTRRRAIMRLNPDMTDDEIEELMSDIDEESTVEIEIDAEEPRPEES